MTMGDRIHPSTKKFADSSGDLGESTNPQRASGARELDAPAELHEPHIEPAALEDAPGS